MKRTITALLSIVVGVLAFTGTAGAAPGNSGAYGTSFVDGADAVTDDWGDHFGELGNSLCNGCADSWNTDLVMMWQSILVSEGLLGTGDIDGQFGPRTASATRSWQTRYGIGIDGQVGTQTWSKADDFLYWRTGSELVYIGWNGGEVVFFRGNENVNRDSGAYEMVYALAPGGPYRFFNTGTRIQFYSKTIS
jgi:putative peptidoglycan binding protein